MSLSRREFAQLAGLSAAIAAAPRLTLAQAPGSIRLSANENPYGPSPLALEAMRAALAKAPRYPDAEHEALMDAVSRLHSVARDQIVLGDGSGENLKLAAAVFTAPGRRLVMASPTFEAMEDYARSAGADTVKVPLDAKYAHDLEKMAAVADAGLIYICNPNNPTATITPKAAVRAFLKAVPPSTMVFVDEAYHHYAESDDYESVIPLVASHPNLIVSRTFSKIYAMAGIRAGYSISSAEAARRMLSNQVWRSVNVVALSGARASLSDTAFVTEGRRRNTATRRETVAALKGMGFDVVPSEANFVMIDVRKHVKPLIASLRENGVRVGRLFPAMPEHLRVTIGTPQEMQRFLEAFKTAVA